MHDIIKIFDYTFTIKSCVYLYSTVIKEQHEFEFHSTAVLIEETVLHNMAEEKSPCWTNL